MAAARHGACGSAPAAADPAFKNGWQGLWPQAQALGRLARTFDAATRGVEPDLTLPDLDLPGREGAAARPGRVRADAGRLHQGGEHRAPRRAGQRSSPPSTAARSPRSSSNSACRATCCSRSGAARPHFGGYRLPKNAITVLATQGYYGRRKDFFRQELLLCAQDAGGGPRQARRHAQLLGRRHGAHPVPAVRVLQIRRRFRRRRQEGHLEFGAGCARLRRAAARRQGLAARHALGL